MEKLSNGSVLKIMPWMLLGFETSRTNGINFMSKQLYKTIKFKQSIKLAFHKHKSFETCGNLNPDFNLLYSFAASVLYTTVPIYTSATKWRFNLEPLSKVFLLCLKNVFRLLNDSIRCEREKCNGNKVKAQ